MLSCFINCHITVSFTLNCYSSRNIIKCEADESAEVLLQMTAELHVKKKKTPAVKFTAIYWFVKKSICIKCYETFQTGVVLEWQRSTLDLAQVEPAA